jgi:hypothetical protein
VTRKASSAKEGNQELRKGKGERHGDWGRDQKTRKTGVQAMAVGLKDSSGGGW